MQKIHVHNDFDVHLNFTNIKTDYVSRVEFWTRRDDIFCCCKCDGSLKVEDDSNIVCYLNDHNLGTGKLNYNVIFQIPDPNYADGYKKVCQHYVSDIFLTSENGDTTVAIVKVIGGEEATNLINRLSEFEKVFDNKQDKLAFDNTPTSGSKNVVYSDGIYNAIKNNKPDLSDYAKKSDLEGLATEQWVDDKGYITSIPDDYVTETELNSKGYITEHQSLEGYAKKTDLQGLATEQWVNDKGYLTEHQSLEGYVTETELNSKGYVPEKFDSDNYNSHIDVKRASIFLDSQNWMKYVKLEPWIIQVYDKGTKGQEIYTQLTTNTIGVVKSTDGKEDLAAFLITDEGKGSLRIKDSENELNISVDGITIKEGFYEYNISLSKIKDMATKSDLQGLATEQWVNNQGYLTSIPDVYAKKTDIPNTSIKTVTPAADTEYTLNSNQYLRIIPAAAVKLTFNILGNTDLMKEYHIVIDCQKAVPTVNFKGVLWGIDNDPVFEKGGLYDIVIRYDGDNYYGSCKSYKLMPITILITTSGDGADDISINGTTYKLAAGDNSLTNIGFNTITDISGFYKNYKITSIDFGGATIKNDRIRNEFEGIYRLTKISNITIKGATDLFAMFRDDSSLKEISVANWDVSNVVSFSCVFQDCRKLETLDVSRWDTSSAKYFNYTFKGCESLDYSLDVSGWNTSKVTNFSSMFRDCSRLRKLDVSHWDTSSATDFSYMFNNCTNLTYYNDNPLDVSGWNTSKVTDFSFMFAGCRLLTKLDVSGWNTSKVTNFVQMFAYSGLTKLDVSKWDTSKATNFYAMFYNCNSLTTLDVSKWNTSSATNFANMFYGCSGLTTLDVSNWDTSSATDFAAMFDGCSGLTSLDLSSFNTSKATNFANMFYGCSGLTSLDVSKWDVSKATSFSYMFNRCSALTTLDLSGWNISTSANITDMLKNCNSLTTIRMVGCSQATIDKIKSVKPASATIITE